MKLLHIDSAITSNSASRELTHYIVDRLTTEGDQVQHLDLHAQPIDHLAAVSLGFRTGQQAATQAERDQNALSEQLVSQFLDADTIVIGAPMYNFSIPSQLKAWLDRLAQAGRTFRYTEKGPEGLAGGRRVIVVSTRGGQYAGTPFETAMDHQEAFLRTMFGFMGIANVEIVRAERLAMDRDGSLAAAKAHIDATLTAPVAA
ncbi:FMN-dependent NADH-azoreductase [Comamonas serinivorans]|uniref:FMN dependent NADH:quinone oxidoreductase n=1 Tax=Comamonas serinivorans TaxID=1082851 RepID=A0A1Y0ENT2_9BURK|nr:NAD(P)H-dependent oxidoreductase [Comamonas serinivorans]ARU05246.1 FMN-dependent NADH-azoreductase [Comamonas serinivorans]